MKMIYHKSMTYLVSQGRVCWKVCFLIILKIIISKINSGFLITISL